MPNQFETDFIDVAQARIAGGSPRVTVHADLSLAHPGVATNYIAIRTPRGTVADFPGTFVASIGASTVGSDLVDHPLVYVPASRAFTGTVTGHVPAGQIVIFGHVASITLTYNLTLTVALSADGQPAVTVVIASLIDAFAPTAGEIGRTISFEGSFFSPAGFGACAFQPSLTDHTKVTLSNLLG